MVHLTTSTGSTKAKVIFAFAIGFLALQVIVPSVLLSAPRPTRFGWQMYSGVHKAPTFWLVTDDGTTTVVDLGAEVGHIRLDIDYQAKIPRHLCDTNPHAVLVRYEPADSSSLKEYPCR